MMPCDMPCLSYMALYIISMHVMNTNSRTSTHWKLNLEAGKVQTAVVADAGADDMFPSSDPLMNILTNKVNLGNGVWKLEAEDSCTDNCQKHLSEKGENDSVSVKDNHSPPPTQPSQGEKRREGSSSGNSNASNHNDKHKITQPTSNKSKKDKKKTVLDCGKIVNFTEYDHLRGIADRKTHPHIPEPEVAMIFKKKDSRNTEVDMADLEKRLRKTKREKPRSAQVYNQIGNFWRIKGNTQLSVECFRKALSISPDNPDVLLNLARVLFNLQYLDDAIALTRQSLKMQSAEQNSWLQHFTLGEILKAYGNYHEAALHFRHALDLNPNFQPAELHLREMEVVPDAKVTYYTLCIILFLVLGVMCGILTSIDPGSEDLADNVKTQRHFNRAMAMRSIKLGINPKLIRMRKQMNC